MRPLSDEQYERWFMAECCRCGQRRHKAGTWLDVGNGGCHVQ
jgi:hypothetical protein